MSATDGPTWVRPREPEVVPNQYIVVFKRDTTPSVRAAHRAWASERHFETISTAGHGQGTVGLLSKFTISDTDGPVAGYCARIPQALAQEINDTDEVDFIEQDYKVYALDTVTQENAPWGLARLSHTDVLTPENKGAYTYDAAAGEGTYAYIIDTGILAEHEDFEGRATFGYNAVPKSTNTDLHGHGTHVAGTIGGTKYGVAKKTHLIGVKVLGDDGSGTNTSVIAGIQWALADAQSKGVHKCVANMSLGGGKSRALNIAVAAAVRQGFTIAVAAGNEGANADTSSPASEPTVITVGATGIDDRVPSWSNWGPLVDIFAPGHLITSSWIDTSGGGATNLTNTISGTSMATPHIAGLVAYLLSVDPTLNTPAKVLKRLTTLGVRGKIVSSTLHSNTINLLAQNGLAKAAPA
ncbi:peptidase S8/S53 domain-containing protein [Peziza echinospora]|nr:peptidase S8/S53 domain-containing protein [Peziza echinospora]